MLNNPFHEEIPLLWHWPLFTEAHSVTPHHPTPSQLSSTHSKLEKVLCSPATMMVRALLLEASPKAQPAQSKLACPTAAMASEMSQVSPVSLPADVLPSHTCQIR